MGRESQGESAPSRMRGAYISRTVPRVVSAESSASLGNGASLTGSRKSRSRRGRSSLMSSGAFSRSEG